MKRNNTAGVRVLPKPQGTAIVSGLIAPGRISNPLTRFINLPN